MFNQGNILHFWGDSPLQCARPIDAFEVLKIGADPRWMKAPGQAISRGGSLTAVTTKQRPNHRRSKHLSPITEPSPPPPSLMGFLSMLRRAEGSKIATPRSPGVICIAASVNRSYFPDMNR